MLMIFCKQSGILHGIKMLTIYKNLEFFKPSNMDYRLYIYMYILRIFNLLQSFIWSLLVFTEVDWNTKKCV